MNGMEYREAIVDRGMTQVGAARFFGVDGRTSRKWIAEESPVPPAVAQLLQVMLHYDLSPGDVRNISQWSDNADGMLLRVMLHYNLTPDDVANISPRARPERAGRVAT